MQLFLLQLYASDITLFFAFTKLPVHAQYREGSIDTDRVSSVAQMIKNLPAMQDTWVQSLGQEDPLEKRMPTHSSILAWRIPQTEEPRRLQSMRSQRVRQN